MRSENREVLGVRTTDVRVCTTTNNCGAIWKSLQPLLDLAAATMSVSFGKWSFRYDPPHRVGLSPILWRRDGCQRCGRSCEGFALAFLPGEAVPPILEGAVRSVPLIVDGKQHEVRLYRQRHRRGDRGCDLLEGTIRQEGSCSCRIHDQKPLHCALPHMRVLRNQVYDHALIARTQYGRNWALGCPVKWSATADSAQIRSDRRKLARLLSLSEGLGIPSRLPGLIRAHEEQGLNGPDRVIYV